MSLDEIKLKVPNANYPPKEDCKYCGGTGFKKEHACICLFVEHSFCEEAGKMLGEFAREEKKKLENGEYNTMIKSTANTLDKLKRIKGDR